MALLRKSLAGRFPSLWRLPGAGPLAERFKAATGRSVPRKGLDSPARSEDGLLRRVLQNRSIFQSSLTSPVAQQQRLSLPVGEKLIERLRSIDGDRIRLDVIGLPVPVPPDRGQVETAEKVPRMTVEDARKVLKLSRAEAVKERLRATGKSSISRAEFVQICCDGAGHRQEGLALSRALDESGAVLVLGNVVFLRPNQVAKAIESVIPLPLLDVPEDDPRREELMEMERRKAEIDRRAEAGVRKELWYGLAFMVAQTAAFMRLTFWELTWDVMEPICFFVTSSYFLAGYAFFLRTSREPSFEGFFARRFATKQRRLMRAANFDLRRFHELSRAFCHSPTRVPPPSETSPHGSLSQLSSLCDCHHRRSLSGAVQ